MRKITAVFLLLVLLALCACGAERGFVVSLDGNATTGYLWQPGECDGHLTVEELGYELNENPNGAVGVGGQSKFKITVAKGTPAGEYTVMFLYFRPWEDAQSAIEQAVYTVSVDAKGSASLIQNEP